MLKRKINKYKNPLIFIIIVLSFPPSTPLLVLEAVGKAKGVDGVHYRVY
jgi:hypothetical protein